MMLGKLVLLMTLGPFVLGAALPMFLFDRLIRKEHARIKRYGEILGVSEKR